MTSKEIWTIDDIIKDYEEKSGMANRSKIDFLTNIKKDLEILEEIKKNHPDLYNLYKKMKEAESEWLEK